MCNVLVYAPFLVFIARCSIVESKLCILWSQLRNFIFFWA